MEIVIFLFNIMIQYWLLGVMIHYSGQLVNIVFPICIILYIPKRNYNKNNKKTFSIKMKEDVRTSKPKKHVNKVGKLT